MVLGFALIAASVIVSSAALVLSAAGRQISPGVMIIATLATAGVIVALRNVIARLVIGLLLRSADDGTSKESPKSDTQISESIAILMRGVDEYLASLDIESELTGERLALMFVLWSLLDNFRRMIAPWIEKVYILIHKHGIILAAYPEEAEEELDAIIDYDVEEDIEAIQAGNAIYVWIDYETFNLLVNEIGKTEELGDHIEVRTRRVVEILYTIAKKIYEAVNPGAPDELAAYTAYKTLKTLVEQGVIRMRIRLTNLQLERKDLWNRIRKQLEEEELEAHGKNPKN